MNASRALPVLFVAGLMACQNASEPDTAARNIVRSVKEVAITEGMPVVTANLSIDGMTCDIHVRWSDKDALNACPACRTRRIEVRGGRREALYRCHFVTYDDSKVTEDQIKIQAVQELDEGQYKVLAVEVTKQVRKAPSASEEANPGQPTGGAGLHRDEQIVVPSLLELLSG